MYMHNIANSLAMWPFALPRHHKTHLKFVIKRLTVDYSGSFQLKHITNWVRVLFEHRFHSTIHKGFHQHVTVVHLDMRRGPYRFFMEQLLESVNDEGSSLELKIAELGLFPYHKWSLDEFPVELHQYCGKGIGVWQYPCQLAPLLQLLVQYDIKRYLEIGVAAGGTFTLMCELLKRHSSGQFYAVACDPAKPGSVAYLGGKNPYTGGFTTWLASEPNWEYIQEYSERLEKMRPDLNHFDCVFIDGDHSLEGCLADFEMALRMKARIIIIHDIVSHACPGVVEAWQRIKTENECSFFEFTNQYESVNLETGKQFLGIGVAIMTEQK